MSPTTGFRAHLLTVVAAVTVAVAVIVGFMYDGGAFHSILSSPYRVQAVLPTAAAGLSPGARVTMAGAQVGRVTSVQRRGLGAVIGIAIEDHSVTPIPRDSNIQLRLHTAVGENYVALTPGRSRSTVPSGGILPASQAGEYVDVDQLLSVLQGTTRERTRQLVQALGGALKGRGAALNGTVAGFNQTITPLAHVVATLHDDRAQVSRLVQQLGDVAAAAGERGASIMQIGRDGLTTFRAIAARDDALRRTLDVLPSTLSQVRSTSNTLGSVTNRAAPVVTNLAAALHDVQPAVHALSPAATEASGVVQQLGAASPSLTTTLARVRSLSGPAASALPSLQKTLCQIDPILNYAEPYTKDVNSFVGNFGSAVNAYDAIGHVVRISAVLGENSINGLPPAVSQAAFTLLHAGVLGQSTGLTWDPYPKPGMIGKDSATGSPHIVGPAQLAKTGYEYPHIAADC